ncbi:Type IV pilus biogenesis protein PilN [hydrothermal vent metagenome]|uniref:Type IV pilus biogenesis protein PilN n=1 Tax=hydrothermal vent metagenome TaxID=652676 RepID=A0A3B1BVL1_9ZZZZ
MARINLLPWREALRKQRQRELRVAAGGMVVITLLLLLVAHMHIAGLIKHQESRNSFLKAEIAAVENQIKEIKDLEKTKAKLLARMEVIQELQSSRPGVVHLFDELVKTVPEGVILSDLQQSGKNIKLSGQAQSNARVSAYMRNIDASEWIGSPVLEVIQSRDKTGTGFSSFRMRAKQISKTEGSGE